MTKLYETITAENWAKGVQFYKERGKPGCLMHHGFLSERVLTGDDDWFRRLQDTILCLFPERAGDDPVPCFNDHPDTTLEDVLRVCKVADV